MSSVSSAAAAISEMQQAMVQAEVAVQVAAEGMSATAQQSEAVLALLQQLSELTAALESGVGMNVNAVG